MKVFVFECPLLSQISCWLGTSKFATPQVPLSHNQRKFGTYLFHVLRAA